VTCETCRYLTPEHIEALIQCVSGLGVPLCLRGRQGEHLLASSLAQPQQSFGGKDLYPTLPAKAAILFFCLVKNHPFVDGNKRFAVAVLEAFLDINGYVLSATDRELVTVTEWLASSSESSDLGKVRAWLELRVRAIPPIGGHDGE